MRKATEIPYSAAMERLKELVGRLEEEEVDVDELAPVVKESVELITSMRARLRATQTSVESLLAGLKEEAVVLTLSPAKLAAASPVEESDPFADD